MPEPKVYILLAILAGVLRLQNPKTPARPPISHET
jgi:hypothetical protein